MSESLRASFRKWTEEGVGHEDVHIIPLAEALAAEDN